MSVSFQTQNTFKQQNADVGYYSLSLVSNTTTTTSAIVPPSDAPTVVTTTTTTTASLAEGSFAFEPHWAPAKVSLVDVSLPVGVSAADLAAGAAADVIVVDPGDDDASDAGASAGSTTATTYTLELVVSNAWGQETRASVSCDAAAR